MDFKVAFNGKEGLLEEWESMTDKIIKFLSTTIRTKDKNVNELLANRLLKVSNILGISKSIY